MPLTQVPGIPQTKKPEVWTECKHSSESLGTSVQGRLLQVYTPNGRGVMAEHRLQQDHGGAGSRPGRSSLAPYCGHLVAEIKGSPLPRVTRKP